MVFDSRFGAAADAYAACRPGYSPELFERILAAVPLDHRSCAMDLGAGTGKSTHPLLEHFSRVIAVEPDPRMAEKLHASEPLASIQIATAEDTYQQPGSVDLVVIATALHWMDVPRVMTNVASWLRRGGVLAVCGGPFPHTPKLVAEIIRKEFNHRWNAFRDPRLDLTNSSEYAKHAAHALNLLDDHSISYPRDLTHDEFAGFCRSTSYGNAYARSLADPESYWHDLAARFRQAWPEDTIPVDFSTWLVLAAKE